MVQVQTLIESLVASWKSERQTGTLHLMTSRVGTGTSIAQNRWTGVCREHGIQQLLERAWSVRSRVLFLSTHRTWSGNVLGKRRRPRRPLTRPRGQPPPHRLPHSHPFPMSNHWTIRCSTSSITFTWVSECACGANWDASMKASVMLRRKRHAILGAEITIADLNSERAVWGTKLS